VSEGEFAPAKVNLFLHVGPVGSDGYHNLESWMVFADIGDGLIVTPASAMEFEATGTFAEAIPMGGDNLVVRARDAILAASGAVVAPFRLTLSKSLPTAAGLGGGSSDAAAALRLLRDRAPVADHVLFGIAVGLGSDVPACLYNKSVLARGRGQKLETSPMAPPLPAVLVNPRVPVTTRDVFKAYDKGEPEPFEGHHIPAILETPAEVAQALLGTRNDLQRPTIELEPVVGEVLAALNAQPQTLIARMSGSGATCFALCETQDDASQLEAAIGNAHPGWWVRACTLA
jgi:4-diphosphocytidyl-2-C-methyl-D-erythritol kinase